MGEEIVPEEVESAVDKSLRGHLDLDIYSMNDLSTRLDVHYLSIHKAVKTGTLRGIKFGSPTGYRFFHEDIIEWLDTLATRARKSEYIRGLKVRL